MAKEGVKGEEAIANHYKTICELVDGDVSAEVLSTDFATMVEEGKKLAVIHPNIVVKVPMIKDGVKPSSGLPIMVSAPTVHWYSLPDRPYWPPKQVLPMYLPLLAVSTIAVGMVWS